MKNPIVQSVIIEELGVKPVIDVKQEIEHRVDFLVHYLRSSFQRGYVLGISGGIDSTVAGRLAQLAVEKLRAESHEATFMAVRLPYNVQHDEADAKLALEFIKPDRTTTVNIHRAADAMLSDAGIRGFAADPKFEDFVMGNIKARMRMVAQYALAGFNHYLVIGTDHASEAVMGFFTKYGDGGADVCPLAGLTKDQVQEIGVELGVPLQLINKAPTADLESLNPGKTDEEGFGIPYEHVNMYLKGQEIPEESEYVIMETYIKTIHKRNLPVTP